MSEIEKLVPWGSAHPKALPQQMLARVEYAIEQGREVHVMACVIEKNVRGNYCYTCSSSPMPGEVSLMAAHEIKAHVLRLLNRGE